ncbi:hypothetical protein L596_009829 [Steinernema carpocapsae]|uniref:Uncharacterized protein n=1 Tax=Steinernema carpocapsae TaxID=34508 RepID=A0A4U5PGG3_STECR|nr:hypothetical protein L596_009829 [Steinernema carpocapsae]
MCSGDSRQRGGKQEKWTLWLLCLWSVSVNIAIFCCVVLITVRVTEIKPTEPPDDPEHTTEEKKKDFDATNLIRVTCYIVAVVLLIEMVFHGLLIYALIKEKRAGYSRTFVAGHVIYQIIMMVVFSTILIIDFLTLLSPKETEFKVIVALLIMASILRRGLSLVIWSKYYGYIVAPEIDIEEETPNDPNARPLGEVDYVDEQASKKPNEKETSSEEVQKKIREHVPFSLSSHYINHEFYDRRE